MDAGDFILSTKGGITSATVTAVSGTGSTYMVTVDTGTGNGTIHLDVLDRDNIVDRDGNPLGGLGFDNGSYITGEFYDVQKGSILIDPARLDFEDNVICGWSATKTVTVSNVGAGPVQLGKLSISDSDTDGQTMFLKGNSCDNAILKAGASCTFRVASQLASQGNVIGQVIIPSDVLGEAHIIDLSGNGICWFSFLTNFPLPEWVTGWVCHSSSTGIVH